MPPRFRAQRWLDALVFSSLWVAGAAAALTAASTAALGLPVLPALVALAFCGTLLVYTVDRLRDQERDRATSPERTAFVARHRRVLVAIAVGSGASAAALGLRVPAPCLLPPLAMLPLALGHRRLKRFDLAKTLYVTAAWLAIVVGMPAMLPGARGAGWAAGIVGLAILANAMASNVRDLEAGAARFGPGRVLAAARTVAAASLALALAAPGTARPLAAVCAATLAALVAFRPGERYGLAVVDGALIAGGSAALWLAI